MANLKGDEKKYGRTASEFGGEDLENDESVA